MALEYVLADARGRALVDEVGREEAHALLSELGGQRAQPLLATSDQHERRSRLAREPARGRLSDPARGARDERDEWRRWGVCVVDDEVLALVRAGPCRLRRSTVSLSDRRDHEPEHLQRPRAARIERPRLGPQARGARAVPRPAAALRPAVGSAQLRTGPALAARSGRARWRRRSGERVLDVATGTGMVAAELIARSGCSVVGIDQSAEMLSAARARFDGPHALRGARAPAGAEGRARVELIEGQAEELPFADGSFDALTFTYLLRYVDDPRATMRELARVVRARRAGRIARVRRAPARDRALGVAAVHGGRAARARTAGLARVGRGGPLPRPEHQGLLRAPSGRSASSATGTRPACEDVAVRRMSLGGGIVMSARKAGAEGSTDVAGA